VALAAGNVVRLGFLYGDPSEPFVGALATAAIGTVSGSQVNVEGYGLRPALIAEHLVAHSRLGVTAAPVNDDGTDIPGSTVYSALTRFDFRTSLKDGDRVAALPIEEGARFIVVAKIP
jgi:mRNA-degrading endonuclease toxin of MazEF toxin-antitoxin module